MIDCGKCQFKVSSKMRYALTSNACPACGNKLLSHKDEKDVSAILSKIRKQEFSTVISDSIQQDIAIFILFEFEKPSQQLVNTITMSSQDGNSATVASAVTADDSAELDAAAIREQVRKEALMKRAQSAYSADEAMEDTLDESESDSSDDESDDVDGDMDPRAARLKKLAQTSPILQNNKHVRIRRID